MSDIRVTAVNAENNFARLNDAVLGQLMPYGPEVQAPDVLVVSEAYRPGDSDSGEALMRLGTYGYQVLAAPYDDADGRKDAHIMVMAVRQGLLAAAEAGHASLQPIRLAGRTAIVASLANGIDVIGYHGDDRSDASRAAQIQVLLGQLKKDRPTVIAGDFNAMHRHTPKAWLTRGLLRPLVEPLEAPAPDQRQSFASRRIGRAKRLVEMAQGRPMALLRLAGYRDADRRHRGTRGPAQLDHIMVPRRRGLRVKDFQLRPMYNLSDHRGVQAVIQVPETR